jgi:hypothetical protein
MAFTFSGPPGYHLEGGMSMGGLAGYNWVANDPTGEELAAADAARTRQLGGLTDTITNLQAGALGDAGAAAQAGYRGAGAAAEAEAYRIGAGYAEGSASMALGAAGLRKYQEQLNIMRTLRGQRAATAAAGFGEAGTSVDLLQSTIREGAIATSLIDMEGNLEAMGYLAEAATLTGQSAAATSSRDAAFSLQTQYLNASQQSTMQALELQNELDKLNEASLSNWGDRAWGRGPWDIPGSEKLQGMGGRGFSGPRGQGLR